MYGNLFPVRKAVTISYNPTDLSLPTAMPAPLTVARVRPSSSQTIPPTWSSWGCTPGTHHSFHVLLTGISISSLSCCTQVLVLRVGTWLSRSPE